MAAPPPDRLFLGLEFGGTKLQIALGDSQGQIFQRWRFPVDPASGGDGLRQRVDQVLPNLVNSHRPAAIGVGFGGPVRRDTGRISRSHQMGGWEDYPLVSWLEELSGLRVAADNDANLAALGEAVCGAGRGLDTVFYVTLGSGVGGGCVTSGRLYHGAAPGECEIGHVRLDRSGLTVEERCSGWAVDRTIRERTADDRDSVLARLVRESPGHEARHLREALEREDPLARSILETAAADLAFGLSHIVHLMHPEVLVLGGGLSLIGEPWRLAVARALPGHVMTVFRDALEVRLAALGEDAVPVGALLLASSPP